MIDLYRFFLGFSLKAELLSSSIFYFYPADLRKSEVIDKLKKDSIKFIQVESSELEEVLEKSESSYQLVFVHVPWCNGTKEIFPQVEALTASREQDMDFFRVALTKEKDSKLLEGVWLSPTIKLFKNKEEVSELVNPSTSELSDWLGEITK